MPTGPGRASRKDGTIRILFVFSGGRADLLERVANGSGPDDMLYGFPHFDPMLYSCRFIEDSDIQIPVRRRLWKMVENRLASYFGMGFRQHMLWEHREAIRCADIIVTTTDSVGLPFARARYHGRLRQRLLYFSQGLSDRFAKGMEKKSGFRRLRNHYTKYLSSVDGIVVLGNGARTHLSETLDIPLEDISVAPFGVDTTFWHITGEETSNFVLSVGSDPARDYQTLLAAAEDANLHIVTRRKVITQTSKARVQVTSDHSDRELLSLYNRARFVVTPLLDVAQPSGQSATLQAMACGKAVILSNTQGLWDDTLKHMENCVLVPPENTRELSRAIRHLGDHPEIVTRIGLEARKTVEKYSQSKMFAARIQHILSDRLDDTIS